MRCSSCPKTFPQFQLCVVQIYRPDCFVQAISECLTVCREYREANKDLLKWSVGGRIMEAQGKDLGKNLGKNLLA